MFRNPVGKGFGSRAKAAAKSFVCSLPSRPLRRVYAAFSTNSRDVKEGKGFYGFINAVFLRVTSAGDALRRCVGTPAVNLRICSALNQNHFCDASLS